MTRLVRLLHGGFAVIGGVALVAMLFVTVLDIVLRAFGAPLPGTYEIIGWLGAGAMASALGYTQAHKGHVAIELLILRLPERARLATKSVTSFVAALLFAIAAWQLFVYARELQLTGSMSETLHVPVYPWVYLTAAGVGVLALMLVCEFATATVALARGRRLEPPPMGAGPR